MCTENEIYRVLRYYNQHFKCMIGDTPDQHEKAEKIAHDVFIWEAHKLWPKVKELVPKLPKLTKFKNVL